MATYVALLRGINVGGKNVIKMADLKACFERLGMTHVMTYIQSGNVLFDAPNKDPEKLTRDIEAGLLRAFGVTIRVVIVSHAQLKAVVQNAPSGFGKDPAVYRYDVIFLKEPLTAKEAIGKMSIKEGVDQVFAGKAVLYFSRVVKKATQSKLAKIITLPMYQQMTIRNWNTTTKLLTLIEK